MSTDPVTVQMEFPNEATAEHFLRWLVGAGEQDYYIWMQHREKEDSRRPIAVTAFKDQDGMVKFPTSEGVKTVVTQWEEETVDDAE